MNSSFHHLLLNENDFFYDIISIIVLLITSIKLLINLLIIFSDINIFLSEEEERYSYNLFLCIFQFVLMKLYDDCVNIINLGIRLRMISIGRWSEIWSFSMIIWYFNILFIIYSFSHIKSIVVFLSGNMIISNEIINCIFCWNISVISSFIYRSCLWYCDEFYNKWYRLKSFVIMITWYWERSMFCCRYLINNIIRFSSLRL